MSFDKQLDTELNTEQTTGLINGRCPLTLNLPNNWTYQWKMSFNTELDKQLDLQWKMSFNTELDKQLDLSMEDVL